MGKMLIAAGIALVLAGIVVSVVGKLPGDLTWRGKNWTLSFPLATCLLLSVLGSGLLWLWNRFSGGQK